MDDVHQPAGSGAFPLRLVGFGEAGWFVAAVEAPTGEQAYPTSGDGVDGGAGEHQPGDIAVAGRGLGSDLCAAGMPSQHHRRESRSGQPLADRPPELRHRQLVRRLAAAAEARQLDQMGTGPLPEGGQAGQQVVGDGHALHEHDLGYAGPRPADGAAAHPAEHPVVVGGGNVVRQLRHTWVDTRRDRATTQAEGTMKLPREIAGFGVSPRLVRR